MTMHTEALLQTLNDILAREPFDQNDFISLVTAGGQLERTASLLEPGEYDEERFEETLMAYAKFLAQYDGPYPGYLHEHCDEILRDLEAFAHEPMVDRLEEQGIALLLELDQLFSIAVVCTRLGQMAPAMLEILGKDAYARLTRIAPRLPELTQFAEDHELVYAPDPDYPYAFSWWEALASLAPTRLELRDAVIRLVSSEDAG